MEDKLLAGEPLRQELRQHYHELLSKIANSYSPHEKLTGFAPLVGSQFLNSGSRLFLCGRAVDGWRNTWNSDGPIDESLNGIFKIPGEDKDAMCEMNWLDRNRKKWVTNKTSGYNYRFSSFWSSARDVQQALEGTVDLKGMKWTSRLAWSNVYKISPDGHGNPGESLRKLQKQHCINILETEINHLEPKNILFVTGDWGKKILEAIGITPDYSSNTIVQFAKTIKFKYGEGNVVVAIRPERQKRNIWVKEVVSAFGDMSKNA